MLSLTAHGSAKNLGSLGGYRSQTARFFRPVDHTYPERYKAASVYLPSLDVAQLVGWQSLETRGRLILETAEFGLVALVPIGMSPVSSVSFEPSLKDGARVRKRDMMGHFLFVQAGYNFTLDFPHNDSQQGYSHLLMGQRFK